jgi:hypothetical protein
MSEMGSSATEAGEAIRPCTSALPRKRPFGHDHAIILVIIYLYTAGHLSGIV